MLLDTSGFYALLDASDGRHPLARQEFDRGQRRFTHGYVLAELVPLAQVRGLDRRKVLAFISTLLAGGEVEVVWPSGALHAEGHRLLENRPDKAYSLCDAVSFVLMRRRHVQEALTTDRHFEQEGLIRLLPA